MAITKLAASKEKDEDEQPRRRYDSETQSKLDKLTKQISDLHDWHNVNDEDGIKLWYLPLWLRRMIESISKTTEQKIVVLENIEKQQTENLSALNRLVSVIDKLEARLDERQKSNQQNN